jgi:hypothetical protein
VAREAVLDTGDDADGDKGQAAVLLTTPSSAVICTTARS